MERKANSRGISKKGAINLKKILRRPIVRITILVIIIILGVLFIKNCISNNVKNNKEDTNLVGYQKLVNVKEEKYTFINLDGKIKTYDGYLSMDDFYYDTTCVSKISEDNGVTQMALINTNNKQVVKYGTYNSFTQVVGGKFYKVEKDGKYGVIDYKGKEIIKPEYNYISITTVQEATEVVFECQKENKYYFANENGKIFYETDVALHSISYANKFNKDYHSIIYISENDEKKYFDLVTGEQLFEELDKVNLSYNILSTDGKISFYDKNSKLKTELDTSTDYSSDARVYFKKYIVVEQKNVTSGTREYKYSVYDSNFKKLIESKERISPVQDIEGNVYFIINESDGVKIINENKKETKIEGYEFNGNNINNVQYIVLNLTGDVSTNEVYTLKGKKVLDKVTEYSQKGYGLVIKRYNDAGEAEKFILLGNDNKIALSEEDNVYANDYYITIENSNNNQVSVIDSNGKIKLDKVSGAKAFYVENYIGIQSNDTVSIYNINNGKLTFTYKLTDYINRDETVNVIETTTGYYTFDGKLVVEK